VALSKGRGGKVGWRLDRVWVWRGRRANPAVKGQGFE